MSINVADYVKSKTSKTVLANRDARVLNNLAVAGIVGTAKVTTANKSVIDSLLVRLERKLGQSQQVTTAKKPSKHTEAEQAGAATYTASLRKNLDPATGEALSRIKLLGGYEALHNTSTRVVYPIPASGSVPAFV